MEVKSLKNEIRHQGYLHADVRFDMQIDMEKTFEPQDRDNPQGWGKVRQCDKSSKRWGNVEKLSEKSRLGFLTIFFSNVSIQNFKIKHHFV